MVALEVELSTWYVLCDGGCPTPGGPGAYAFVIKEGCTVFYDGDQAIPEGGIAKVAKSCYLPSATNNVAEYAAVTAGAWWISNTITKSEPDQRPRKVKFFGDSQLIQRQLTGRYRVLDPDLFPHYDQAQRMLQRQRSHTEVDLYWFRREHNWEADKKCNETLISHGVSLKKASR